MAWSTWWLMMRLDSECSISVLKADYPNLGCQVEKYFEFLNHPFFSVWD
jgi:hypothetical protein